MFAYSPRSFACPTTDGADIAQSSERDAPMRPVHALENERLKPLDLGAAEGFDIDPVVGAGDDGADGGRDDVAEFGAFRRAPFAGYRRWRSGL